MQRSTIGENKSARYTFDGTRGQSIVEAGPLFRRRVVAMGAFLFLLTIVNISMCSYYSYISGACATLQTNQFIPTCKYDTKWNTVKNATSGETYGWQDMQTCFVQSNFPYPQSVLEDPSKTGNVGKTPTSFPTSMAFLGQQTLVYTWLAFGILFRSLNHYEWLQSTISFMLYAMLGVTAYYAFNPYLPFPHQTPATVVSLTAYVRSDMYDNLPNNEDGSRCDKAYQFNVAFLAVQYMSVGIVAVLLIVALKAEGIRRRYPLASSLPPLKRTTLPCVLAGLTLVCYAVMVISKADASLITVEIFRNAGLKSLQSLFPFAQGSVDIVTVFLIVSTMSVIRGTSRQSTSAFRLAAVAAVIHVALVYPSIMGSFEVMKFNDMWNMGDAVAEDMSFPQNPYLMFLIGDHPGCKHFIYTYFLTYYNDMTQATLMSHAPYIAPTDSQAAAWCKDTWVAVYAQVGMLVCMHLQVLACLVVYKSNQGRPTEEEPGDGNKYKEYANSSNAANNNSNNNNNNNNYSEPLLNQEKGVAFAQNVSYSNSKV